MANRLSKTKIEELWAAWQEFENVNQVATKCGVHHKTVERYLRLEKWDERLAGIKAKAQQKADYDLAQARAEDITIVRAVKRELIKALKNAQDLGVDMFAVDPAYPGRITGALDDLVKLELLLMGEATERHGFEGGPPVINFITKGDDED